MQRWRLLSPFVLLVWTSRAGSQELTGFDALGVEKPIAARHFAAMGAAEGPSENEFIWGVRTSYVYGPLSLRYPSPDPGGTSAKIVEGVVPTELTFALGIWERLDVGIGLGAHVYQWGAGTAGANGGETLPQFATRDPRLAAGYTIETGSLFARPFTEVKIPLGSSRGLAGEATARGELGALCSWDLGPLTVQGKSSLLLRRRKEFSSTAWGTQFLAGVGVNVDLFAGSGVSLEGVMSPVLAKQPAVAGTRQPRPIPAEILLTFTQEREGRLLLLGGGLGLPISAAPSQSSTDGPIRAPTSPVFRVFLEVNIEHEGPQADDPRDPP